MIGHKVKKSILAHTPTQEILLENCSVEFHKIKRRVFSLMRFARLLRGRPYISMQNKYRISYQKRENP